MKKVITIISALALAIVIACDDGGSSPTGTLVVNVTNNNLTIGGILLIGVYDNAADAVDPTKVPPYDGGYATAITANGGYQSVPISSSIKVGDYYVTGIVDVDTTFAGGLGNPCSSAAAPYFLYNNLTYADLAGGSSLTAVTITENQTTTIDVTIPDGQINPNCP